MVGHVYWYASPAKEFGVAINLNRNEISIADCMDLKQQQVKVFGGRFWLYRYVDDMQFSTCLSATEIRFLHVYKSKL